jgi:hypothetical protein
LGSGEGKKEKEEERKRKGKGKEKDQSVRLGKREIVHRIYLNLKNPYCIGTPGDEKF